MKLQVGDRVRKRDCQQGRTPPGTEGVILKSSAYNYEVWWDKSFTTFIPGNAADFYLELIEDGDVIP